MSCRVLGVYVKKIGTSSSIAFCLTLMICRGEGHKDCNRYISYILVGYNLIFSTAARYWGSVGISPTGPVEQNDAVVRRSLDSSEFLEGFDQELLDSGLEFDGLEERLLSELDISKRDTDPAVKLHATIKGIRRRKM
ncbi:hypothetical protein ETB97_010234 [Aspergillus alliaceus]|uniref:Uncharacterized protein n=1 Tax=Petromyces alliaceus TaxID=209559 RepID=A0A8H6E8F3_PETAA|nr:hypothetical protein ETB97_010234 [Aspergillus burnettii]